MILKNKFRRVSYVVLVVVVLTGAYTGCDEPEVSVTARAGEAPTPHLGRPLMDLKVVNDVSENAVQMATDYKELITKDITQRKMLMVIGGRCSTKAKQVGPASNSVAANPEQVASQSEQSRYKSEEKLIYLQKMS